MSRSCPPRWASFWSNVQDLAQPEMGVFHESHNWARVTLTTMWK